MFQLVFDEYPAVVPWVAGHDVRPERANLHFGALELQFEANLGREMIQIVGEPRREVVGLVAPGLAQINRIQ